MKGILGRKLGMTQVFNHKGILIPVTVVEVPENIVVQVKNNDKKDKYVATTLAAFDKRENLFNKPDLGKFKKINAQPKRYTKEIRNMKGYQVNDKISAEIFIVGQFVDVTAVSKGKGFSGAIKRHNYSRGPMGHGSGYHRGAGSMGAIAPNRVFKSKKMPGHMGFEQVTIQNLEVIFIDKTKNLMLIKGSVPGPKKQFVVIKDAIKRIDQLKDAEVLFRTDDKQIAIKESKTKTNSL